MKAQDLAAIKNLSLDELKVHLTECREKLFQLKFKNAVSPLKNGLEIRTLRRHRARLMTWIHQKENIKGDSN